jgi:hypothetical protein
MTSRPLASEQYCSRCDHVEKIAIALDPMKSGDVGWLVGELRSPN